MVRYLIILTSLYLMVVQLCKIKFFRYYIDGITQINVENITTRFKFSQSEVGQGLQTLGNDEKDIQYMYH